MRTKNFLVTLCVIVTLSVGFIVFGQHKPDTIQSLVSSTNEQIQSFKVSWGARKGAFCKGKFYAQDNLRDAEAKTLVADQGLLDLLGFQERQPRLFPADVWRNSTLPVVVTMVTAGQESQGVGVVTTLPRLLPNSTILVYDLGLSEYGLKVVSLQLTSQATYLLWGVSAADLLQQLQVPSGGVRSVRLPGARAGRGAARLPAGGAAGEARPPASQGLTLGLFQDALSRTGAILYVESSVRFLSNVTQRLMMELTKRALDRGVVTFPVPARNPVTSLTHKKMFEYFRTDAENFQFLQMVSRAPPPG